MHHHPGDAPPTVAPVAGRAPASPAAAPCARASGCVHRMLRRLSGERGAATAEYAVATMATVDQIRPI